MRYGVSYYPEHKEPEALAHDLILLKESGINTVRMGEFAWCRMEKEEGSYDFDWLKQVVEELGKANIQTILCTPTACPPAWLIEKHPDILYMDNRRIRRPFGGRRHYCYNNETYRHYSVQIAVELSRAFADNPYIAGVQIDNEPAQEGTGRCCCPVCEKKFQVWLKKAYGTIEEWNRRSGAVFWSQEYDSFEQIKIPVNSIEVGAVSQIQAYYENPTLRMEFERFCSYSQKEYQDLQADSIRQYLKAPVTTNGTGLATNSIDYYESSRKLDCYAFDYYPGLRDAKVDSFPYAFARGVKDGKPFWVLEFMSGGGHRLGGSGRMQPNPGALKQAVVQSMAHGGELMLHFQFRTYPFGAEQLNYAIVDMDGVPRRRYQEMQETAALLRQLEPLEQTAFAGDTAVCFDYPSAWALRIKPVNDPIFHYVDYCGKCYRLLEEIGVNADVISLQADWTKYRVIVLPATMIMTKAIQNKVKKFVEEGGSVVATFLTSVKNEDNVGYTDTLPSGLTQVFGTSVEEWEPVFDHNHTRFCYQGMQLKENTTYLMEEATHPTEGNLYSIEGNTRPMEGSTYPMEDGIWSELLGGDSEALAVYQEDYKTGSKVISHSVFGKGHAYYVGTDLPDSIYREFLNDVMKEAHTRQTIIERENGVELVTRYGEQEDYLFLFNFTGKETIVTLPAGAKEYLSGTPLATHTSIERNGTLVVAIPKA